MIDTESKTRTHFAQLGEENKQRCWNCVSLNIFVLNLSPNQDAVTSPLPPASQDGDQQNPPSSHQEWENSLGAWKSKETRRLWIRKKFLSKKQGGNLKVTEGNWEKLTNIWNLKEMQRKYIFLASLLSSKCKCSFSQLP